MLRVAQSLADLQLHQAKINHEPITMKTVKVAAKNKKAKASKRLQLDPLLFCTRDSASASTSTLPSTNMESSCDSSYGLNITPQFGSSQESKGHHRV